MMFSEFFEQAGSQAPKNSHSLSESHPSSPSRKPKKRRRRRRRSSGDEEKPAASEDATSGAKRHSSGAMNRNAKRQRVSTKGPPSEEALALSARLKEYSSQKRLKEALELYWSESNDQIRDGHHACIVVDCCGRCGDIAEGEKIVNAMKRSGVHINVETKTALLKGYAHSGMMHKAAELFRSMCLSKVKRDFPNVRTLNTVLRGCLWTAASAGGDSDGKCILTGGVVTSETCWELFHSCASNQKKKYENSGVVDCSSYEYYIAQLCYSLRVEDAKAKIDEMKRLYQVSSGKSGKFDAAGEDPSLMESLCVSFVALARAMALLMQNDQAAATARCALDAAETAKRLMTEKDHDFTFEGSASMGGKRSWKKSDDGRGPEVTPQRRSVSNSLFRSHRLSEAQSEASDILTICSRSTPHVKPGDLVLYLMTRLMYFSGGGSTDLSSNHQGGDEDPCTVRCQLMNALWFSFGLQAAFKSWDPGSRIISDIDEFKAEDLSRVQDAVGLIGSSVIADDGFIDFQEVFRSQPLSADVSSYNAQKRPLDIELGSGFGDWIIHQAMSNPSRDYVAVELRSDRVAQTFAKSLLNGSSSALQNLCCVGSECGSFLRTRIRQETASTIFVNHPEPPTQTFGSNTQLLMDIAEGGSEPAHMLNSETLVTAAKCLSVDLDGRLIIVTDNRWYARLICVTLLKVIKTCKGLICSSELSGCPGICHLETFGKSRDASVVLYEGQPSEAVGHSVGMHPQTGSSYFDRLWRTGAGTHAQRKARFIISMERVQEPGKASLSNGQKRRAQHIPYVAKGGKAKTKKNKKKSDAKQKRRNERRLLKRAET